jgi:hypothetical protein
MQGIDVEEALKSFMSNEREILAWPAAEFSFLLKFKAQYPEEFSAQFQMLNNLVESGIL